MRLPDPPPDCAKEKRPYVERVKLASLGELRMVVECALDEILSRAGEEPEEILEAFES